ncbi:MAG: sugar ABC transporter permease [Treponema sp.]|nr:sugar ABC transporter permease [Treponema sp.]
MVRHDRLLLKYILPVLALLVALVYFPLVKGLITAFRHYNLFDLRDTSFIGFDNFKAAIGDKTFSFAQIFLNTMIWIFASLLFQFVLGFALALLLRKPFKGRGLYSGLVFYTWALSGFAIGLLWSWIFNGQFGLANDILMRLGIIDSPIGFLSDPRYAMVSVVVVNVWYGIPFFGIMLLAALQSVPNELYEAATIDGAGRVTRFFKVTVPFVAPVIVSTTLLRMMWIMNFPEIIFGMTNGGPANATNILATQMLYKIYKEYDYGQASAISFMIMAILFAYSLLYLSATSRKERDF